MARMIRPKRALRWHSFVFLSALALITVWMTRSVRVAEIPSESMLPTLRPGDLVLMRIDAYRHQLPKHGDLVIFHDAKTGELLVKRVLGVPGDEVAVSGGAVWINKKRLREPYARKIRLSRLGFIVKLGQDQLWVMGDNRENSSDSRDFGPISKEQLVGRGAAIIWPLNRRERITPGTGELDTEKASE